MEELRDIEKFAPDICGLDYNRSETAIVHCSFHGQWKIQEPVSRYDESNIILAGDRYLFVKRVELKQNWIADYVGNFIKGTNDKIFMVSPTPYLKESLKEFNVSFVRPPRFYGEIGYKTNPKVKYVEIEKFTLDGNKTSEKDDLKILLSELVARKKIIISQYSNFDELDDTHIASLILVLKEMLPLLVRSEIPLLSF